GAPDVRDLLVIEGQTDENVLQYGEAVQGKLQTLRASGAIGGYDLGSNYLPSRRTQQDRQSSLPEPPVAKRHRDQALKGLPFSPGLVAPFVAAVESARTKTPIETKALQDTALGARMASLMFEHAGGWTAIVPLRRVADRKQLAEIVAGWNIPAITYVD